MGTRSDIIVHRADGKWHRIYCHWDGYLEHNGRILFDHYTDQKHVEALVALGDLSSLGERIGTKHPFERPARLIGPKRDQSNPAYDVFMRKHGKSCTAYGRDCGEKDVAGTVSDSLFECWPEADTWTEFTYVWDEGKWWVTSPDEGTQTLVDLGDALQGKRSVGANVKAFGAVIGRHHKTEPGKDHGWTWPT